MDLRPHSKTVSEKKNNKEKENKEKERMKRRRRRREKTPESVVFNLPDTVAL